MQGKIEDPESIKTCAHCGGGFQLKNGAKIRRAYYCGYCQTTMFGKTDPSWLPRLRKGESLPIGFQRVR